jgi:hypothetical protein
LVTGKQEVGQPTKLRAANRSVLGSNAAFAGLGAVTFPAVLAKRLNGHRKKQALPEKLLNDQGVSVEELKRLVGNHASVVL